jgi:hypothetical protein
MQMSEKSSVVLSVAAAVLAATTVFLGAPAGKLDQSGTRRGHDDG